MKRTTMYLLNTRHLLTIGAVLSGILLQVAPAHASLTLYGSRLALFTANPGLTTEGFETGFTLGDTITGPMNYSGFSVEAVGTTGVPGSGFDEIFYHQTSNNGNTSNVLTTNDGSDSMDITFPASGIRAFGVDIGGIDDTISVSVFNSSGNSIGTTTISPSFGTFGFLGFTSDQDIARVNIDAPFQFETIDNLSFGASSAAAPEPGSLCLAGFGILSIAGIVRRRRNSN